MQYDNQLSRFENYRVVHILDQEAFLFVNCFKLLFSFCLVFFILCVIVKFSQYDVEIDMKVQLIVSWKLIATEIIIGTIQKVQFSIKDFFSKCDQICNILRIWSHLRKKSLM